MADIVEPIPDNTPYRSLKVSACQPNDWNPNKMDAVTRDKLQHGIRTLLQTSGHIPPIVVRKHPSPSGGVKWQIIDGFHRWDILRQDGVKRVDAYVLKVDTKTAMILTDTLNYLRGSPDKDLQAEYYRKLVEDEGQSIVELAKFVRETEDELRDLIEMHGIEIQEVDLTSVGSEGGEDADAEDADMMLEAKFVVSKSQQEVIERELARIGAHLEGKNIRGRALEYMAVNSSQTSIHNLMGSSEALPGDTMKKKKKESRILAHDE